MPFWQLCSTWTSLQFWRTPERICYHVHGAGYMNLQSVFNGQGESEVQFIIKLDF